MQARLEKMQAHVVSLTARLQQVRHVVSCCGLLTNATAVTDSWLQLGSQCRMLPKSVLKTCCMAAFGDNGSILFGQV